MSNNNISLPVGDFAYEYFIKDHLRNVSMIFTVESALTGVENAFYTIDQTLIVANTAANNLRDANQNPQTYEIIMAYRIITKIAQAQFVQPITANTLPAQQQFK